MKRPTLTYIFLSSIFQHLSIYFKFFRGFSGDLCEFSVKIFQGIKTGFKTYIFYSDFWIADQKLLGVFYSQLDNIFYRSTVVGMLKRF